MPKASRRSVKPAAKSKTTAKPAPLVYPDPHVQVSPVRNLTKAQWKALALEAGNKLASAVAYIPGKSLIKFKPDGSTETVSWEDDVVETLKKFPGARIDREAMGLKYLNARERARFHRIRAQEKVAWMDANVPKAPAPANTK